MTAKVKGCASVNSVEKVLVLVDANIPSKVCGFSNGPDVQPILDVSRALDYCAGKIFPTIQAANDCVMENSAGHDVPGGCRPIVITLSDDFSTDSCAANIVVSSIFSSSCLLCFADT